MENVMKLDDRFAGINDIADNSAYYIALSELDRATVARILFDAGYCSHTAKSDSPDSPKRKQWAICHKAAADVIHYGKAAKGFLDVEGYYIPDSGDGWDSDFKYSVRLDGSFWDNENGREIYCPYGALKCLLESASLFHQAFKDAYNISAEWTDSDKVTRLAQFTNGVYAVIQKERGRKKAAKAMALYREAIRHRNASYAIKYNL